MYELKKDISMPGRYWRAGSQKTKEEWKELFPDAWKFGEENEWFIDLAAHKEEIKAEAPFDIVKSVFEERGLRSISYREAAVEACHRYEAFIRTNAWANDKHLTDKERGY